MNYKWILVFVIILLAGCVKEVETEPENYIEGEFVLYASSGEDQTRTTLRSDGAVWWSPGDRINVFYGDRSGTFSTDLTEPSASAEFSGSIGPFTLNGEIEFIATYPYSKENTCSSGILGLTLPSVQTGAEGTFADNLFLCVAKSRNQNLHFYNVCGGVKFSVGRDDVKKVVFKGNDGESLAGHLTVEFSADGLPLVSGIEEGSASVTVLAPDGGTFQRGTWYYVVLAPQELNKGFTLEFWSDTLVDSFSSDNPVTVKRSVWGVVNASGADAPVPQMVDLGLSVKWASFNLGASQPEEQGLSFAWGETEPKDEYSWATYKWCQGTERTLTKYCGAQDFGLDGFTDFKTTLEPDDDAAHVYLGGKWRLPTHDEVNELFDNCIAVPKTVNKISGYLYTSKINGNSIFLPKNTTYWCSTLFFDTYDYSSDYRAWSINVYFYGSTYYPYTYYFKREVRERCYAGIVRPVWGDISILENISLNETSLSMSVDDRFQLQLTFKPEQVTNKKALWTSSNILVATVSETGEVRAIGEGEATISVITEDGLKKATCQVSVNADSSVALSGMVDLGLPSGLKWAACNLGADKPEEYGDYYCWSSTEPFSYSIPSISTKDGTNYRVTKYSFKASHGLHDYLDYLDNLDPEDDAAHVQLGGKWRMPTKEEWQELMDECAWICTQYHGVWGIRVTSKTNGNSLFFPAAGWLMQWDTKDVISYDSQDTWKHCRFWSSSIDHEDSGPVWLDLELNWEADSRWGGWYETHDIESFYYVFHEFDHGYGGRTVRNSIRPVYGEPVPVDEISLDKTQLEVMVGSVTKLCPVFQPEGAHNKRVSWSSQNPSVATVSDLGVVSALSPGSTVITATSSSGRSTSCNVSVSPMAVPTPIDMGLSVKWASFNLGAASPDQVGNYYAWGETSPKFIYSAESYKWYYKELYLWQNNDNDYYNKYILDTASQDYDGRTVLEPEDDAAHVNLGGNWRMPTKEEWQELVDNCTWRDDYYQRTSEYATIGYPADYGFFATSKITGNSIFFPTTQWKLYEFPDVDSYRYCYFWSSSLKPEYDNGSAYILDADTYSIYLPNYGVGATRREYGIPVRPVYVE